MDNFLNTLLTAAAGYGNAKAAADAQVKIAQITGANATTAQSTAATAAAAANQIVPGISNTTVFLGAGALLALAVVAVIALRR